MHAARLIQDATIACQNRCSTGVVCLDIEKAFDKVWHEGLIWKLLYTHKLPLAFVQWVASYLQKRKFFTLLNKIKSSIRDIKAGVPKGSPLFPILYNLYTADVPKNPPTNLALFADDTCFYYSNRNIKYVISPLQRHLNIFQEWADTWKIKVNTEKTKAMIILKQKPPINTPKLMLNNTEIPLSKSLKYLGVIIDSKLNFIEHINKIITKGSQTAGILYPLLNQKSKLTLKNKTLLYQQVISSQICYAAPIISQTSKKTIGKLQIFQNKILRRMTRPPWYVRNSQIHANLQIETVQQFVSKLHEKFKTRVLNHPNPLIKDTNQTIPNPIRFSKLSRTHAT
ncbi:hypothetical protein D910_10815 [Dendroctonus ponderosae]|uniref:Reverse transcriptase domain-containing protein n=1 Tax=Dendroctonus ponderosae TaxID=77166 RepID=U4UTK6_DENPD|nr:hypothetical protein D910_10815 [Dendroctonus ponderosae]